MSNQKKGALNLNYEVVSSCYHNCVRQGSNLKPASFGDFANDVPLFVLSKQKNPRPFQFAGR